jgi:PAS domain S-box-containing protein
MVVDRNPEMRSIGVRRNNQDGPLIAIGDHAEHWKMAGSDRSIETHVSVPLRNGAQKWGYVEVGFNPITQPGWIGYLTGPWTRLFAFLLVASFLSYMLYLKKMLQHLDPSQAVPNRVRSALDTFAEGLLVLDQRYRIMLANPVFAGWVGKRPDQLVGKAAASLSWLQQPDQEPLSLFPWEEAMRDEESKSGRALQLIDSESKTRKLKANASPVMGHDGKYRGILVSLDDVTQLEKTKQLLSDAKDAAEAANQSKSEFLARMSHEIRTPMNSILGFTDALLNGYDGDEAERNEYLGTIHSSGQHLLDLINDILDLSKIEAGRLELELVPCSPHQIIFDVVRVLQVRVEQKDISLSCRLPEPLPETIYSDPAKLRQILMNLVGNAIKFTERGGVELRAQFVEVAGNPRLAIEVHDTGIGMSADALEKIFQPFAQADSSITRRFGGTGLGLAISRRLSEALGGKLEVESEPGAGSIFRVTIDPGDLTGVPLIDAATARTATKTTSKQAATERKLPPMRILVADDGESNRKLLSVVLGRAGATVEGVENGQLAVEAYFAGDYDVILMDMHMPVMDGFTATRTLRDRGCRVPIIALTADAMKGAEDKCRAVGCSGFVTKPIDMELLIRALADIGQDNPPPPRAVATRPELTPTVKEQPVPRRTDVFQAAKPKPAPQRPRAARSEETMIEQIEKLSAALDAEDDAPSIFADTPQPKPISPQRAPVFADLDDLDNLNDDNDADAHAAANTDDVPQSLEPIPQATHRMATVPASPDATDLPPIRSTLPMDDPEFREIVEEFVERLHQQRAAMQAAWDAGNLHELERLAHWLKGAGGTAGFDALTGLGRDLENLAKDGMVNRITDKLNELARLAARIDLEGTAADEPPSRPAPAFSNDVPSDSPGGDRMESTLPMDDPEFREIVEEFVERLREKIDAMRDAWQADDFGKLAELAHWLKGSGGTAGFVAFTTPARELECAAKAASKTDAQRALQQLQRLTGRIAMPAIGSNAY